MNCQNILIKKIRSLLPLILLVLAVSIALGSTSYLGHKSAVETEAKQGLLAMPPIRSDASEAIDAELALRFAKMKKNAEKMIRRDGDETVILHKYGETIVPKHPQRVAVIGMEDLMVALDAPMVAAHDSDDSYLHAALAARHLKNISINTSTKTINWEQVQAAEPDLIILRDSYGRNAYNALRKIAPVIPLDLQQSEKSLLVLGAALGLTETAENRLQQYYDTVKAARMKIKGNIGNATIAMVRVLQKEVRVYPYSSSNITSFMYELLNLCPAPMTVELDGNTGNHAISYEQLPDLKADYLVVSSGYGSNSRGNNEGANQRYEKLQKDPLWNSIPAVRDHRVKEVDPLRWNAHGIIAKENAIQDLVNWLGK